MNAVRNGAPPLKWATLPRPQLAVSPDGSCTVGHGATPLRRALAIGQRRGFERFKASTRRPLIGPPRRKPVHAWQTEWSPTKNGSYQFRCPESKNGSAGVVRPLLTTAHEAAFEQRFERFKPFRDMSASLANRTMPPGQDLGLVVVAGWVALISLDPKRIHGGRRWQQRVVQTI